MANKRHKPECQRRSKIAPNAGEKVRHLAGSGRSKTAPACWVRFVHRPARRSSPYRATKLCGALGKPGSGICSLSFTRLTAVSEAVALTVHFQDVNMMGQAVEQRTC